MKDDTDQGGINLLLFDADEKKNGGGFSIRKDFLLKEKERLSIEFELFLFPNNEDDGDFEVLISRMVNQTHQCLLDCFKDYEYCVAGKKESRILEFKRRIR